MSDKLFINLFQGFCPNENIRGEDDCLKILGQKSFCRPQKFILFFNQIVFSDKIPDEYAKPILKGIISRLFYETGLLPAGPEKHPHLSAKDKKKIIKFIFHSITTYEFIKSDFQLVADGVKALSPLADDFSDMESLIFIQMGLAAHLDPEPQYDHKGNLYEISQKSVRGKTAQSVALLLINFLKQNIELSRLLKSMLLRFATDPHPAVRIALLIHLKELAAYVPAYSWRLFHCAFQNFFQELWPYGEPFLCSQIMENPEKVLWLLEKAKKSSSVINSAMWSQAMGRAFLSGALSKRKWLESVALFMDDDLWGGLFDIFLKNLYCSEQKVPATDAIMLLMEKFGLTPGRMKRLKAFFEADLSDFVDIKIQIAYNLISVLDKSDKGYDISWFYKWLLSLSQKAPTFAFQICEALITRMKIGYSGKIWHKKKYSEELAIILKNSENMGNNNV